MSELQFDKDEILDIVSTIDSLFKYEDDDKTKKVHPILHETSTMIYWCEGIIPSTPNFHSLLLQEIAKYLPGMKVIFESDSSTSLLYNECVISMKSSTGFRHGSFDTSFTFTIETIGYKDLTGED